MKKKKTLQVFLFSLLISSALSAQTDTELYFKEVFTSGVNASEVHSILNSYTKYLSKKETCRILEDSVTYRAYVRKRISQMDLPFCLEYLPIIESSYKPTAKPVNGVSMGIWQFMPNSVKPYMELSEYVDERRDPWISTEGALKKLEYNFKTFGDWLLALAAYNCGAGAVSRALEKASDKSFTGLCNEDLIPDHAKSYVKNFLYLCDNIMNASLYGEMELYSADIINEYEFFYYNDFDYVTVKQSVSLEVLAMETRMDYEILKKLNLSLVKEVTPPDREYSLRVPYGMKTSFEKALENIYQ